MKRNLFYAVLMTLFCNITISAQGVSKETILVMVGDNIYQDTKINSVGEFTAGDDVSDLFGEDESTDVFVAEGYEFGVGPQPYIRGDDFAVSFASPTETQLDIKIFIEGSNYVRRQYTVDSDDDLTDDYILDSTSGMVMGTYIIKLYDNGKLVARQVFIKD